MLSWLAPLGATCCFLIYASGIFPPGMDDLALTTASVVATPGVTDSQDRPQSRGPYLRFGFTSSRNLMTMAQASGLNTYPMIVDCADRDLGFYAYGPFQGGLHTSPLQLDGDHPRREAVLHARANTYAYEVYLPVSGEIRSESDVNRRVSSYDLSRETRTLCIRFGGGNMAGGYFRSNEVRVAVPLQ